VWGKALFLRILCFGEVFGKFVYGTLDLSRSIWRDDLRGGRELMKHSRTGTGKKRIRFGLRVRLILSFLCVAVLYALLLESLAATAFFFVVSRSPNASRLPSFFELLRGILLTTPFWLVVAAPAGVLLGLLFTRGLVKRVQRLLQMTASVANGDYGQRVPVTKQDEIGQLEEQFNCMTEQLVESIRKQRELVEYNARAEERARMEQELQTAWLIQHALLPKELPTFAGWQLATHYQPAREVGGDLYDFLFFDDGQLGLVIGDVADKGVPAAMVMASTRSMLRAAAQASGSPGEVLARVNDLLYVDTPAKMFVTCFYAILDPTSGRLWYANAGHDLPYQRRDGGVAELLATGMPLGLMPGMRYEERETRIVPGESILFYSDGLVEAHNSAREMFGFPRLKSLLAEPRSQGPLVEQLLDELRGFTGEGWEQEDDVTLVLLQRMG
jgi:serine phosphatase RsbU (regulator of sigma subunit)